MHLRKLSGSDVIFPYTLTMLKADFSCSYSSIDKYIEHNPGQTDVFAVEQIPQPDTEDTITQVDPEEYSPGKYRQKWNTTPLTAPELAARIVSRKQSLYNRAGNIAERARDGEVTVNSKTVSIGAYEFDRRLNTAIESAAPSKIAVGNGVVFDITIIQQGNIKTKVSAFLNAVNIKEVDLCDSIKAATTLAELNVIRGTIQDGWPNNVL